MSELKIYIYEYLITHSKYIRTPHLSQHFPANPLNLRAHLFLLTGFVATKAWLLATAVRLMIVTTELQTKEKNRFLCKVILWQLRLLRGKRK